MTDAALIIGTFALAGALALAGVVEAEIKALRSKRAARRTIRRRLGIRP